MRNASYPESKAELHDLDPNPSSRTGDAVQSVQRSPRVHIALSSIPSTEETGHGGVCVCLHPLTWDTEPVSTGKKKSQACHFLAVDPQISHSMSLCLSFFDHTRVDDQGTTVSRVAERRERQCVSGRLTASSAQHGSAVCLWVPSTMFSTHKYN